MDIMTDLSVSRVCVRVGYRGVMVGCLAIALLAACSPSPEEAKQKGFMDVAEMERASEAGFTTPAFYAEHLGYENIDEMRRAPPGMTANEFAASKGCYSMYELRTIEKKGFSTMQAYATALGFKDVETYRAAQAVSIETPAAYDRYLKRKADPYFDFPADQRKFAEIVSGAQKAWTSDTNEMKVIAMLESRNAALCGVIKGTMTATDWHGKISRIDSEGGHGVLEVEVASEVTLTALGPYVHLTQGGATSSIAPDDPVFKKVAALSVGQEVLVSGRFFPYREAGECLAQIAYNPRDRLKSPDFIFWFKDIKPVP
jgi:hypothetical protein